MALKVIVRTSVASGLDLADVASATIRARLPVLSEVSGEAFAYLDWVPTVVPLSALATSLVYPFVLGDLVRVGRYRLKVDVVINGAVIPCTPCSFLVVPRF